MANVSPWPTPRFEAKSLAEQWHEAAVRPAGGLSEAQLARLQILERSTRITDSQAGEAQALAQVGDREQRDRALKVWERSAAGKQASQIPKKMIERMK